MDNDVLWKKQLHSIILREQILTYFPHIPKYQKNYREIRKKSDKPPPAKSPTIYKVSNKSADFTQKCKIGCFALILLIFYYSRAPPMSFVFKKFENQEDKKMEGSRKYTIIVNRQRIEVSEDVYHAYHQEREAERYQNKLIRQHELSLERFRDYGIHVDYLIAKLQPDVIDKLIYEELLKALRFALDSLPEDEQSLIRELFFNHKSERKLAKELGIPRMTLNDKKHRILRKLKKVLDI